MGAAGVSSGDAASVGRLASCATASGAGDGIASPHLAQYRASGVFAVPQDAQNFTMTDFPDSFTELWISGGKPIEKR
jgi:hypothetical protein